MTTLTLENWCCCKPDLRDLIADPSKKYKRAFLYGEIHNHPGFRDGEGLYTSSVIEVSRKDRTVLTATGSTYHLGKVGFQYELQFPGAEEKFFNAWEQN